MKIRYAMIVVLAMTLYMSASALAATVFYDDFSYGSNQGLVDYGWEEIAAGSGYGVSDAPAPHFLWGKDMVLRMITGHFLSEGDEVTLTVDRNRPWAGYVYHGDIIAWDGTAATVIGSYSFDTTENPVGATVAVDVAYAGQTLGLTFGHTNWGETWSIQLDVMNMHQSTHPAPANEEPGISLDAYLTWTNPDVDYTPSKYVLNFRSEDPNWADPVNPTIVVDPVTDLALDDDPNTTEAAIPAAALPLQYSTNYYWRVDTYEPNDLGVDILHKGATWFFTTQAQEPSIVNDPANDTASEDGIAVFTVTAAVTDYYHWKHNGSFVTANPVPAGTSETSGDYTVDNSVAGQSTLTIKNVAFADGDEGAVSCVVSNDLSAVTEESAAARLMVRRLVGWWKLDGNLSDSVQQEVPGAPAHNGSAIVPNFVGTAKDGGGLQLTGDPNQLVAIADSNDYFNFYPQGYTVSCWVNMPEKPADGSAPWGAFVCKQAFDPARGFILTNNSIGNAIHTLRQSFNDLYSGFSADTGNWHLITGTYDAATGTGRIYFNGLLRNEAVNSGIPQPADAPLIFGAENLDASTAPYSGLLDDVRIWNYPLDAQAISDLYTDFNPGVWLCLNRPALDTTGPDIDGDGIGDPDCKVDFYEFIEMAEQWMECGRFPAEQCH